MPATAVEVQNLAPGTTPKALEQFFSFCGTIQHVALPAPGEARVTFANSESAVNAAMLNGGTLNDAIISISPPEELPPAEEAAHARQEDKPKTAIVAEYLAAGYKLSDDVAKRALELDEQNGYSSKFRAFLLGLDRKLGAKTAAAGHGGQEKGAAEERGVPDEPSFVANVQGRWTEQLQDPHSFASHAQEQACSVWATLGSYYTKAANHPQIHKFYTDTSRSVSDVQHEAQRISQDKYGMTHRHHLHHLFLPTPPATPVPGPPGAPAGAASSAPGKASMSWVLVILLVLSAVVSVGAHGDEPAASVAGLKPPTPGAESYMQKHMASEHHINAFDLGSFFALHDLNRDGVWDRSEIEAIYGVHHSTSVRHSPTAEIHDQKANTIVKEVFKRLDLNGDAMVSKSEFLLGGIDALPTFPEYGIGVLGHHYDAESEFFVHHEEKYHSSPDTQKDEAYIHPEDMEHFRSHEKLEHEEEDRERKAEGLPSRAEEARLRAQAASRGERYISEYEQRQRQRPQDQSFHQVEQDAYYGGYAEDEAHGSQHLFRGPGGQHVVKSHREDAGHAQNVDDRLAGETQQGFEQRKNLYDARLKAAAYFDQLEKDQKARIAQAVQKVKKQSGESDDIFVRRINEAKKEATERERGGAGAKSFGRPKEETDRMRKGAPKRFPPLGSDPSRIKKGSFFGEF